MALKYAILASVAACVVSLYTHFQRGSIALKGDIAIITRSQGVESLLSPFEATIGSDFLGYKNHVLRVISYTKHLLPADTFKENQEAIEFALVFHDIGLWTDKELSYLDPSLRQALVTAEQRGIPEPNVSLIKAIILEHHKLLPFHGPHEVVVEAVRQADLVDFSFGVINFGIPGSHIQKAYKALPEAGFHLTLLSLLTRIEGYNIPKALWDLSKIFKL